MPGMRCKRCRISMLNRTTATVMTTVLKKAWSCALHQFVGTRSGSFGGKPVSAFPMLSRTLDAASARASKWAKALLLAAVRWSWASFKVSAWSNPAGAAGTGIGPRHPDQPSRVFRAERGYMYVLPNQGGVDAKPANRARCLNSDQ